MTLTILLFFTLSIFSVQSNVLLDFVAAAPFSYDPEVGGGAYNLRVVGTDVVENLQGNEFSCGDHVTFLTSIKITTGDSAHQDVKVCFEFSADSSNQSGVGFTEVLNTHINYGLVSNGGNNVSEHLGYDLGIVDDGASVILDEYSWQEGEPFTHGALLKACVLISNLQPSESVVLRQDLLVECKPSSSPSGGLKASLSSATRAIPGTTVNTSIEFEVQTVNLEIPSGGINAPLPRTSIALLGASEICNENIDFSVTESHAFAGDSLRYCIKVRNPGTLPLLDVSVSYDSGTPLNANDDEFPHLGSGFQDLGGSPTILDMVANGTAFVTMEVHAVVFAGTGKFTVHVSGKDSVGHLHTHNDTMTITFSGLPHLVFVRHEVTENLLGLAPYLRKMSRCETYILPYWRTTWTGGNSNTLLSGASASSINGQFLKEYTVTAGTHTYSFNVRHYLKRAYYADNNTTRKTSFYLIDYAHPLDSPSDSALYDKAWQLSIVPLCHLESELIRSKVTFSDTEILKIRKLIPEFRLCFDAVTVQLLDTVVAEETLVDHLGKTSALALFANTLYENHAPTRKWQLILTLEDYAYFRDAISPEMLALFGISGNLEPFSASSGYFIPEAYAVHYSYFVTVPAEHIKTIIQSESSEHIPFSFYGILRRELYMAAEQQRLRVLFPGIEPLRWSLLARDYSTNPLSSLSSWKATARTTFSERFPSKYCSGSLPYWAVWPTNQIDDFDGSKDIVQYAQTLRASGVCLVFASGVPCYEEFHRKLAELDSAHVIVWLSEYDSDMSRLAILASDFGFLPNVEAGWPLVAMEMLMHGVKLISPANGGIRDIAIFRSPDEVPNLEAFRSAISEIPSTASLGTWLGTANLCSQIWDSLLPNTYAFTLTRGTNYYSTPLASSLTAALNLAISDKLLFEDWESDYLHSLVLQGHCYTWRSSSLPSLKEYRSMLTQLAGETTGTQGTLQAVSPDPIPFTVNQRAQFVHASEHTVLCGSESLQFQISGQTQMFNRFRSEYVSHGVVDVLGIPGISPAILSRYLVANIIDKSHFPDTLCISLGDSGSFSSAHVILTVDRTYSPLPSALTSLSLNQQLSVSAAVSSALTRLHENNMCHGALSASGILVSASLTATAVDVKLIGLGAPETGDVTETDCMAADLTAWNSIKAQYL